MSETISMDDLRDVLIACAGGETLPEDIADVTFEELGYDSLALIDAAATLKQNCGVVVPDEQLSTVCSPGELLGLVNARLAGAAR